MLLASVAAAIVLVCVAALIFNIIVKQELIRRNPEKVAKLLRALVKAEQFVHCNTAEA